MGTSGDEDVEEPSSSELGKDEDGEWHVGMKQGDDDSLNDRESGAEARAERKQR